MRSDSAGIALRQAQGACCAEFSGIALGRQRALMRRALRQQGRSVARSGVYGATADLPRLDFNEEISHSVRPGHRTCFPCGGEQTVMDHFFGESEYQNAPTDWFRSSILSISKATLVRRANPERAPTGEVRNITLPKRY